MARGWDQFMVRFPDGMRAEIASIAAEDRRSMNSEIVILLERALHERKNLARVADLTATEPSRQASGPVAAQNAQAS